MYIKKTNNKIHTKYTNEEKEKIVLLYLNHELGLTQILREYDIASDSVFYKWVKNYRKNGCITDGRGKATKFNIPNGCDDIPDVNFLCGHTLNELISAERSATEYALTVKNRLNRTIYLSEVNAFNLGQLLFFFMLETAYAGEMLNIDTYNQPGVEGGKNATYALLGRNGYEAKREELNNAPKKSNDFII